MKICLLTKSHDKKPKVFKTGTNINHQTTVSAIKRQPKRRHLYISRLSNSVSTDDITGHCKNKGVDILCIREMSRDESRLKSFHCVFKFYNDQAESPNFWPENASFSQFYLNQKLREWLASFDTWISDVKSVSDRVKVCLHNARSVRNKTSQIRNLIKANDFNLIVLTETWIKDKSNYEFFLQQCCPNGYYYLSANRKQRNGGGLAVFYDGTVPVGNFATKNCLTNAELAYLEFTLGNSVYLLVCIYRRPDTNVRVFISELTSFFEEKAVVQKITFCRWYQYFNAAINWCVKNLDFLFGWIWFATASCCAYSQKWWNFRPGYNIRGGWSIRTSCIFHYKLRSLSCALRPFCKSTRI